MIKFFSRFLLFTQVLFLLGCSQSEKGFPKGSELSLTWKLLANNHGGKDLHKFLLTLENKSKSSLDNKNWEIYFSHSPCRGILQDSIPATVQVIHINGDFFKIVPTDKFPVLKTGEKVEIPLVSDAPVIKYTDAPGGFYIVYRDASGKELTPETITYNRAEFDKPELTKRAPSDEMEVLTAEGRFKDNSFLTVLPENQLPQIIPTPLKASYKEETTSITSEYKINYAKGLKEEAEYLAAALNKLLTSPVSIAESNDKGSKIISLQKKSLAFSKSTDAYTLSITKDKGVTIVGNDKGGVLYGIQSLRSLLPLSAYASPASELSVIVAEVEDAPQFAYRGMLLDAVRHFHSKQNVLKLLEGLSFYKINKFVLIIADDEAWRLEIKSLPELTELSSKRGHTTDESNCLIPAYGCGPDGSLTVSGGHYSRADFIEILKYAKQRNIEVIPLIDLPGHARAAIKAMDLRYNRLMKKGDKAGAEKYLLRDLEDKSEYKSVQLFKDNVVCPCNEGVYNFLQTVTDDIKGMYTEAGLSLSSLHIGGDEVPKGVWEKSPACDKFKASSTTIKTNGDLKNHFMDRCNKILADAGVKTSAYEEAPLSHLTNAAGKDSIVVRKDISKSQMQVYVWNNVWTWGNEDLGYQLANEGYPVVLSNVTNLYFDLAYTKDPDEPGFYWGGFNDVRKAYEYTPYDIFKSAYKTRFGNELHDTLWNKKTRLTAKGKSNIIGMTGLLFSETLKKEGMMEYYTFPKVIGLAERAWSKTPSWSNIEEKDTRIAAINKDWNYFVNALGQRELPRLDYLAGGFNYYLPAPGVVVENGMLRYNVAYPGLIVRYTTDGSEPTAKSPALNEPVKVTGLVKVATFSRNGRLGKVAVVNTK